MFSWLTGLPARRRRRAATRRRSRLPALLRKRTWPELLEDRLVPANFTVSTLADSGPGSLRQAILDADAHANTAADPADRIAFTVAGTISVASQLPALSDTTGGTVIDGTTAPGYAGAPVVVLHGPGTASGVTGLLLTSASNGVWALQVDSFAVGIGVNGAGATGNVVSGNYVGTNGVAAVPNATGISLTGASNNRIGTDGDGINDALERNVISGNSGGSSDGGVRLTGAAVGNVIAGNYIGTNAAGAAAVGNSNGILVQTTGGGPNTVGGASPALRNLISGNSTGILLSGAAGVQVQGNYIGTNAAGTAALGNGTGVGLQLGANRNLIGGTTAGAGNVISGNSTGIGFVHSGTQANLVQGNLIGTNAAGTAAVGNTLRAIDFNLATNNTIGGTAPGAGNVISGNKAAVYVGNAPGNFILGNLIGTTPDGVTALGNAGHGVEIFICPNTTIAGNTIAFNGGDGVYVSTVGSFPVTGNLIRSNAIYANAGLGIDLLASTDPFGGGPTANDPGDGDSGPNALQNYPVITLVNSGPTGTAIAGTLNSTPNRTFTLEFFASPAGDGSGYGEGATPLGLLTVATDAAGNASFTATVATAVPVGQVITATATDSGNNTSEFSRWAVVQPDPTVSIGNASVTEGDSGTVAAVFTVTLSAASARPVTVNYATADGTATAGPGVGGNDYQPTAGVLTFAPGETSKTVTVLVNGDTIDEPDETFVLNLSGTVNATPAAAQGLGTILDDDPAPVASVGDASVKEGDVGAVPMVFTITLSQPSARPVSVTYATADGTAVAPGDYLPASGTITLLPGQVSATVTVLAEGDFLHEGDETFTLILVSAVNAAVGKGQGVGTIIDDDNPPVANADDATTDEDTPVTVAVLANDTDPDGDVLTVVAAAPGGHGSAVVNADGSVTYTPAPNFNGVDQFTYTISDGRGFTAVGTVNVVVNPVNDPPVANDDGAMTDEDTPVTISVLANDTDVDGDTLTVAGVSPAAHGSVSVNPDGSLTYTPAARFSGNDQFTYTVTDGQGGFATATVSVTVIAVNHPPTANDDGADTFSGSPVTIPVLANDTDPDGDPLAVTGVTQGANGLAVVNTDGTITYTPAAGFAGIDQFTYTIADGRGGAATGTVTVNVAPGNHPPVIGPGDLTLTAGSVNEGDSVGLGGRFVDPDVGQAHTVVITWGDGSVDTVTLAPGVLTFGPVGHTYLDDDPSHTPADSCPITVTVTDDNGASASASTAVIVNNVAPTVHFGPAMTVSEGTPVSLTAPFTDPGVLDTFTCLWHVVSTNGQVVADCTDPTFTFVPRDNGTYTVTMTVTDDDGGVGTGVLTINATNTAPTANVTGPSVGVRGQPLSFTLGASDPSSADQDAGFEYAVNWGDGGIQPATGTGPLALTHVFTAGGTYSVSVTATDKDGGVSTVAAWQVTVLTVALETDPLDGGRLALFAGGTLGDDRITFTRGSVPGQVLVKVVTPSSPRKSETVATFTPTAGGATFTVRVNGGSVQTVLVPGPAVLGRVVAYGQAGDDRIELAGLDTADGTAPFVVPAILFGGDGDDVLDAKAGAAGSVLVGGAGSDRLQGGVGWDILIGGLGEDTLRGHGGGDLLIGGTTDYDDDIVALGTLEAEWARSDLDYGIRVGHLGGRPGGVNGPYVLTTATVHDDGVTDVLSGGDGLDWFFASRTGPGKDKTDARRGELVVSW